jgi:hypothetical protein
MKITRKNPISGEKVTREIDVSQEQLDAWNSGELIQRAMPDLNEDDREFILTGILPNQWDELFGYNGE